MRTDLLLWLGAAALVTGLLTLAGYLVSHETADLLALALVPAVLAWLALWGLSAFAAKFWRALRFPRLSARGRGPSHGRHRTRTTAA